MLKFESRKWYLVATVVLLVLLIAFIAPYIVRLFSSFG